jgi:hypothetical protein
MSQISTIATNEPARQTWLSRYSETSIATADECKSAFWALFTSFPTQLKASPNDVIAGYLIASQGFPRWAVEDAVKDFVSGAVEDHDGKWLPTSAMIGKQIRKVHANKALKQAIHHQASEQREEPTNDVIRRVTAYWTNTRRDIAGRHTAAQPQPKETPEQALDRLKALGCSGLELSPQAKAAMEAQL